MMRYTIGSCLTGLALICAAGCSSVTVTDPSGFTIARRSWAWADSKVSGFELIVETNGLRRLKLTGYAQHTDDTIAGITASVASGFAAGVKAYQGRDSQ